MSLWFMAIMPNHHRDRCNEDQHPLVLLLLATEANVTIVAERYTVGDFPTNLRMRCEPLDVVDFEATTHMAEAAHPAISIQHSPPPTVGVWTHALALPASPFGMVLPLRVLIPASTGAEIE